MNCRNEEWRRLVVWPLFFVMAFLPEFGFGQDDPESHLLLWEQLERDTAFGELVVSSARDPAGGEIGLNESQRSEIVKAWNEFQNRRHEIGLSYGSKVKALLDSGGQGVEELMELQRLETEARRREMALGMERILLPHQLAFAKQESFRSYLTQHLGGSASIPLALASRLKLSAAESESLRAAIERVQLNHWRELCDAHRRAANVIEDSMASNDLNALHELAGADWYKRVFVK
jgi:hypothetical protein